MRALEAGKHVLVEKPITNTAEEARSIFALAEKKSLVALEAVHSVSVKPANSFFHTLAAYLLPILLRLQLSSGKPPRARDCRERRTGKSQECHVAVRYPLGHLAAHLREGRRPVPL